MECGIYLCETAGRVVGPEQTLREGGEDWKADARIKSGE